MIFHYYHLILIYDVLSSYRLYYVQFKEVKILWGQGLENPNTQFEQWNVKGEKRICFWKVNRWLDLQMHTYSDNNN